MEHYIVSRNADSLFPYQAWPTVAKDDNGVLYVAVSGHRLGHVCPFGKNYLYISKDEGKTWSVPLVVNDTAHDDRDGGLCAWGDGNLLITWFHNTKQLYRDRAFLAEDQPINNAAAAAPISYAVYDMWDKLPAERMQEHCAFVRRSRDGGLTWDEPTTVNFSSPHGPVRTADGRLLCAGSSWDNEGNDSICLMESKDDGLTWTKLSNVPTLPHADVSDPSEPHCLQLPNGDIIMIIRAWRKESKKLNLYLTRSTDGGKTFAVPQPIEGLYGAPGHLLLHSSGAVIITYGVRFGDKPIGTYARVSYDNGETWGEEFMVGRPAPVWDHGYPSTVELSDGSLYTVYYQRAVDTDTFNSVLGCRWELPNR
ncbi:MAG: exo-alpha-sialidase [Oscillospiraceae bacterium]|nr:exo-alpha-sialidase [Oscillospiraceae bacterium]